jgi:hypothetical protein
MAPIIPIPVPQDSLLARAAVPPGTYSDAFSTTVPGAVALADLMTAFYTTPLFRAERAILRLAGHRSSRAQLDALLAGSGTRFAVWDVVLRRPDEILLRDASGATASWFQVVPVVQGTALRFGSVVYPVIGRYGPRPPRVMALLLGPHTLYSRTLLSAAARRIKRQNHPR